MSKHLKTILNELATLKSSRAKYFRGGVPVEPENIPRRGVLGPGYTLRQLLELAVSRSVESGRVPVERQHGYLEYLCKLSRENLDDVVECEREHV